MRDAPGLAAAKILRLHDDGLTTAEISRKLGKNRGQVIATIKRAGERVNSKRRLRHVGNCTRCGVGMCQYCSRRESDPPLVCHHCQGLPERVVKA